MLHRNIYCLTVQTINYAWRVNRTNSIMLNCKRTVINPANSTACHIFQFRLKPRRNFKLLYYFALCNVWWITVQTFRTNGQLHFQSKQTVASRCWSTCKSACDVGSKLYVRVRLTQTDRQTVGRGVDADHTVWHLLSVCLSVCLSSCIIRAVMSAGQYV